MYGNGGLTDVYEALGGDAVRAALLVLEDKRVADSESDFGWKQVGQKTTICGALATLPERFAPRAIIKLR
jgi:hypothetical protein